MNHLLDIVLKIDIRILLLTVQLLSNRKFLLVLFFAASLMNILRLSKIFSIEIKLFALVELLELFIASSLHNIIFYLHISLDICKYNFLSSGEKQTFPGYESSNVYQMFLFGKDTLNAPLSVF